MLDEVAETGRRRDVGARALDARQADHGLRPPRLPRGGPALARPEAHGEGARLAATSTSRRSSRRSRSRCSRSVSRSACSRRTSSTTPRSCSTARRSRRRSRPRCSPAPVSPAGRRTSSSRSAPGGSSGRRRATSGRGLARSHRLTLAEAAAKADELAEAGDERSSPTLRPQWDDELETSARAPDFRVRARRLPRDRPVPVPPEDGAAPPRARGREPGVPRLRAGRRSRRCRATIPASSTACAPRCTSSATRDATRPCAASRSSACGTASPQRRHDPPARGARRGRRAGTVSCATSRARSRSSCARSPARAKS